MTNAELLKTSLHASHLELKAKMSPFAGYDMPVQYTSVKEEVQSVRQNVGVFDVSHMGEFFVRGTDAVKFVDEMITNDFASAPVGKAVYSPLCRDNGTVIDDLIAYKLAADDVLICVNASNIAKDWNWISQFAPKYNCTLTNESEDFSLLALQGPKTVEMMQKLELLPKHDLEYYAALRYGNFILARTGYTGEDGFEIFGSHKEIKNLWTKLLNLGVAPCGLAARDVLRLEVCYPLYGHELNDEITPLDAGLKWTVKLQKPAFNGLQALTNTQPKFRLAKLMLDKGIPREGYAVLDSKGQTIGSVTSGTMSVSINKGIALALIQKDQWPKDEKFFIQIRQNLWPAEYTTKAFYQGAHK